MSLVAVGPLKMTQQALVAFVTAIVVGTLLAFKGDATVGLAFMASGFVQAYTINCAVVGHCDAWAWVLSGSVILSVVLGLHLMRKRK
jgi:hypothetical protein